MMSFRNIFIALFLAATLYSCGGGSSSPQLTKEQMQSAADSLTNTHKLAQSLLTKILMNDSTKAGNAQLIIKGMIDIKSYDEALVNNLEQAMAHFATNRVNVKSYSNEKLLDQFDEASAKLIEALNTLRNQTPEFNQFNNLRELADEIVSLDNSDFIKRVEFDKAANEFNRLLKKYKSQVEVQFPIIKNLQELGTFNHEDGEIKEDAENNQNM